MHSIVGLVTGQYSIGCVFDSHWCAQETAAGLGQPP